MIVGVVGHLEDVGRQPFLVLRRVPVFGGILVQDGVCIRRYVFVGVEGNEARSSNAGIDGICHEPFAKTCNDDVVRYLGKLSKVGGSLEPLVSAHGR